MPIRIWFGSLVYFAISKLRNKPKDFLKFYKILSLLSGDISSKIQWNSLMAKHGNLLKHEVYIFFHLNVNSLLSKIDKLRDTTNYIRSVILGPTESKLNSSVTNAEVNINSYSIIRNDMNKNGGYVACYIRNDVF